MMMAEGGKKDTPIVEDSESTFGSEWGFQCGPKPSEILENLEIYSIQMSKAKEKEQLELYAEMDLKAGKPPRTVWNDLDTSFVYTINDIPLINIPMSAPLKVQIAEFKTLDDFTVVLCDNPWQVFRERLNLRIKDYCERTMYDRNWVPEVGQVIFVQIPTCDEIDSLMITEMGAFGQAEWLEHPDFSPDFRNPDVQDKYRHLWTRAIFLGKTSEDTDFHSCFGFNVRLIDFGRDICVRRPCARKALWRFLPYPATSLNLVLLIHGAADYSLALHAKWKNILRTDSTIVVRTVVDLEKVIVVDLVSPTEEQFEEMYHSMLGGKVDESLLPVPLATRVDDKHIVETFITRPMRKLNLGSTDK